MSVASNAPVVLPVAPSFQTRRQIALYRAGPQSGPAVIPASLEALEARAKAKLVPEVFEWVAGGAGAGRAVQDNIDAFSRRRIAPSMLCDVAERDLSVELFGRRHPWPLLVAPIGVQELLHPSAEAATARAAAAHGVPFVLSSVSSLPMETVADAMGGGERWFQFYWPRDPELAVSFLHRAEQAGYSAVVVTVDTQTLGWREKNLDHGYLPFLHGRGLGNYVSDPVFRAGVKPPHDLAAVVDHYLAVFSDLSRTWEDLAILRQHTRLPILVKGVQRADDARRALDHGADGLIVSNHGGRQVEGGVATLDALPAVVRAVRGRAPVLFDGGVRRGVDVFKALALGAQSVLVGRPCMWALAVGGEAGVRDFLANFLADVDVTFALCGKRSVDQVSAADLAPTRRRAGRRHCRPV